MGHLKSGRLQRARRASEKAQRREVILRAADALLEVGDYALPPASRIAEEAGLAKGTLYLYFATKEEIYLSLLGEGYARWAEAILGPGGAAASSCDGFINRYVKFCVENPKTMLLACMGPIILERNIGAEMAYAFKKALADTTRQAGEFMSANFAPLSIEAGRSLFMHMFVLTTGLWQHSHPPKVVREVFEREDLKIIQMDFETDLTTALDALWTGYSRRR